MPKYHFGQDENLQVVGKLKLLGVTIRSDLNGSSYCDQMCRTSYARMWLLRRLKTLGANVEELIEVYEKQIRYILEFAVAASNTGLNKAQISQLEENYVSYSNALRTLKMQTIAKRRQPL